MSKYLIYLFALFSFFPFVQIFPLGTDSQPNALLVGLLLFLVRPIKKIDCKTKWLFYTFYISCVVFLLGNVNFSASRSLFNYFSLFFLTFLTTNVLKRVNGLPYWIFKTTVSVYFIVGLVQLLFNPSFLSFMIPRGDSDKMMSSGRGIVCLTPEPTFYGIVCLLLLMVGYLNFRNRKLYYFFQFILLIQLFLFSKSSMCIFIVAISICLYYFILLLKYTSLKSIMVILILGIFALFLFPVFLNYFEEYRLGILLNNLYEHPSLFVTLDASVNERFNHVFFPITGFFEYWGFPRGFDTFQDYMNACFSNPLYADLFSLYTMNSSYVRIMSAISGAFFELGLFAFFIIYFIVSIFIPIVKENRKCLLIVIITFAILTNAITFSNAIIPFFLGNVLYLSSTQKKQTGLFMNI